MLTGFLVILGDSSIDPGDTVSNGATSSFNSAQVLGPGSVRWATANSSFQTSGQFHLADNGNVFFVPAATPVRSSLGGTAQVVSYSGSQPAPPCFVSGTLIATPCGQRPVEDLRPGDHVRIPDGSSVPILWVGQRRLDAATLIKTPKHRPVELDFATGWEPLRLSPQHGVLVTVQDEEKLVRATHLAKFGFTGARQIRGPAPVTYHHILLPRHSLVLANGIWCESFWPGPRALAGLSLRDRAVVQECTAHPYGPQVACYASIGELKSLRAERSQAPVHGRPVAAFAAAPQ